MEPIYHFTRDQIAEVFAEWNKRATEENWDGPPDADVSADTFLRIAGDIEARKAGI